MDGWLRCRRWRIDGDCLCHLGSRLHRAACSGCFLPPGVNDCSRSPLVPGDLGIHCSRARSSSPHAVSLTSRVVDTAPRDPVTTHHCPAPPSSTSRPVPGHLTPRDHPPFAAPAPCDNPPPLRPRLLDCPGHRRLCPRPFDNPYPPSASRTSPYRLPRSASAHPVRHARSDPFTPARSDYPSQAPP